MRALHWTGWLFLALLLSLTGCGLPVVLDDKPLAARLSELPSDVEIRSEANARSIFPGNWLAPHIDARAEPIVPRELERSLPLVQRAMMKYPPELLEDRLDAVYLVGRLSFFGVRAAGTNSLDRVYLAVRSEAEGFTKEFIEASFHHELSSILLRSFADRFPYERWYALLPRDFVYLGDGVTAIRMGRASQQLKEYYLRDGFVSQYATASVEEDFNSIAQNLFLNLPEFWEAFDRHRRVREKVRVVMDFYRAIHPIFTEDFFRSL